MTLMEFNAAAASANTGLTRNEMLCLPTAPKERSYEEMQSNDGQWGGGRRSYGGFDDERRAGHPPPSRVSDFDEPSRADEVDNWASVKKPLPSFDSSRQKPVAARSSAFGSGFVILVRSPIGGPGAIGSGNDPDWFGESEGGGFDGEGIGLEED